MKIKLNLLGMIALMLTSLTTLAQDTAEPSKPMVVEEVKDAAETLPADTNQLLQELLIRLQQQDLRDPFAPDAVILKEQRRANNEFIEVGPGVNVPTVSLVGVVTIASDANAANEEMIRARMIRARMMKKLRLPSQIRIRLLASALRDESILFGRKIGLR